MNNSFCIYFFSLWDLRQKKLSWNLFSRKIFKKFWENTNEIAKIAMILNPGFHFLALHIEIPLLAKILQISKNYFVVGSRIAPSACLCRKLKKVIV